MWPLILGILNLFVKFVRQCFIKTGEIHPVIVKMGHLIGDFHLNVELSSVLIFRVFRHLRFD